MFQIWIETSRDLWQRPSLWVPFAWAAVIEVVILATMAFGQYAPLNHVVIPPVRLFLGDRFTSYPLFYAVVAEYFEVFRHLFEVLVAPIAAAAVAARFASRCSDVGEAPLTGRLLWSRYASFALVGLLPLLLARYGMVWSRLLIKTVQEDFGMTNGWSGLQPLTIGVGILVNLVVQISFIFSIPLIAIERESIWGGLKRGVVMGWRHPLVSASIAVVPGVLYLSASLAQGPMVGSLWLRWPEIILGYSFLMILIGFLVNTAQTTAAARWIMNERKKNLDGDQSLAPRAFSPVPGSRSTTALALAVVCCLALPGCGATSSKRTLWQASQIKRTIFEKPQEASANDYARARNLYRKVLETSSDENEKAEASVSLAELAGHQGNLDEADSLYQQTLKDHAINVDVSARATYGRARVAEMRGNWTEAQQYYQELLQKYDQSPLAMTVPIQLARTARRRDGEEEGQRAYKEAETYYSNIYTGHPGTRPALNALSNQFLVFAEQKKWAEALGVLEKIQSEYPGTPEAKNAFVTRAKLIQEIKSKVKEKENAKK